MPKLVFFKSKNGKYNCKKCKEKHKKDKEFMSVDQAMDHPDKLGEGAKKRKKLKNPKDKMHVVMKEWKKGTLRSGSGKKVTDYNQAVAIGLKESGQSKKN